MDASHAADFDGEESSLAVEGGIHAQIIVAGTVLSQKRPPSRARIHRERVPSPNGAPSKVVSPSPGSRPTCMLKTWRNQGERQYSSVLDDSPILLGSHGDLDRLELACMVANVDAMDVEPRALTRMNEGEMLPVARATPALAEGTDGVEPAGEAERAKPAQPEALAPWTQGEAGYVHETSQEDSMTT